MENQWAVYTLEACVLVTIVILFLSITSKLKSEDPKKTSSKLEEKSKECSESSSKSKACSKSKECSESCSKSEDSSKKNNFYPLRDGSPNTTVPKSILCLDKCQNKIRRRNVGFETQNKSFMLKNTLETPQNNKSELEDNTDKSSRLSEDNIGKNDYGSEDNTDKSSHLSEDNTDKEDNKSQHSSFSEDSESDTDQSTSEEHQTLNSRYKIKKGLV